MVVFLVPLTFSILLNLLAVPFVAIGISLPLARWLGLIVFIGLLSWLFMRKKIAVVFQSVSLKAPLA